MGNLGKDNGDVLVFGDNECGQLGLGNDKDINTPTLLINDKNIRNIICEEYHPRLPKVTQGYVTYVTYTIIYK